MDFAYIKLLVPSIVYRCSIYSFQHCARTFGAHSTSLSPHIFPPPVYIRPNWPIFFVHILHLPRVLVASRSPSYIHPSTSPFHIFPTFLITFPHITYSPTLTYVSHVAILTGHKDPPTWHMNFNGRTPAGTFKERGYPTLLRPQLYNRTVSHWTSLLAVSHHRRSQVLFYLSGGSSWTYYISDGRLHPFILDFTSWTIVLAVQCP